MKLLVLLIASSVLCHAAEDLTVLKPSAEGIRPDQQLELWLRGEFYKMVDRRSEAFEKMIKSESSMRAWQSERREFFLKQIGGLPERTPLNAQVTGTLQGKGYKVEKILFESRPGFHVTGNLYLPDTPPPWPAVLVACGHSHDGKAVSQYQRASILLAKHGLAAMCYDPIGQGERYQMLDLTKERAAFDDAPHVKSPHPNVRLMCTTEHTMTAISSALVGSNAAQFRIWDGMRVIDYLQTRKDIIADKIGCTGNSGGGTETAYLMALDDRIVAAAPGCFLTTFRALMDTKGPQDGEQNIFGQIGFGMDEADYCIMRAPKPTLIIAGTRDATFDFGGTWNLFRDAKRFYSRLGFADRMDINAPDAPHGFTIQQREAVTRFMCRWLLGKDVVVREAGALPDVLNDKQIQTYNQPDWTQEQLQCTPKGQVLLMPGERSVFQINAGIAASLAASRKLAWSNMADDAKRKTVREVIGAREVLAEAKVAALDSIERDGFSIRKLILDAEPGLQLPALLFQPNQPNGKAVLYLHGTSMKEDAAPGGPIEALVKQGQIVLAAELRGIGETEGGISRKGYGAGWSYVGMRCDDVRRWGSFLKTKTNEIRLVAIGEAAIPALHAAALNPDMFGSVTLRRMIPSWASILASDETFDQLANTVHGVLKHYDLPDLLGMISPKRRTIIEPVDGMGRPIP
jgi:dienelactone hydrolase